MLRHPCILGGPQQREQNRKSKPTPGVTMMHHATKRGFKDCPKCAPLAHPLKGHRWGTGPKRCPARARRANVPPMTHFLARVGLGPPLTAISPGWVGVYSVSGRPVAILASQSTSSLCLIFVRSSLVLALAISLWLGTHLDRGGLLCVSSWMVSRKSISERSLWGGCRAWSKTALLS